MEQGFLAGVASHGVGEGVEVVCQGIVEGNGYMHVFHAQPLHQLIRIGERIVVIAKGDVDDTFEALVG